MFWLFFVDKHIFSEVDICLLPGLIEKKLPFVRRTSIMSNIRMSIVLEMSFFLLLFSNANDYVEVLNPFFGMFHLKNR